jgi:hypothetical protein
VAPSVPARPFLPPSRGRARHQRARRGRDLAMRPLNAPSGSPACSRARPQPVPAPPAPAARRAGTRAAPRCTRAPPPQPQHAAARLPWECAAARRGSSLAEPVVARSSSYDNPALYASEDAFRCPARARPGRTGWARSPPPRRRAPLPSPQPLPTPLLVPPPNRRHTAASTQRALLLGQAVPGRGAGLRVVPGLRQPAARYHAVRAAGVWGRGKRSSLGAGRGAAGGWR